MSKSKFIMVAAFAAAMTITSCSKDEIIKENNHVMVKFSSQGVSQAQTRVSGDRWEGNEEIGVYMVENAKTDVAENASNVKYATSSKVSPATFSSATPIYYPVTTPEKVDFIAYHPYQSALADWNYKVDVADQSNQSNIDLMWAKADNSKAGYDKKAVNVDLPFTHQLVKLNLTIEKGTGLDDLSGLTVCIEGMNTTADFDVKTAKLGTTATPKEITPKDAGSYKYEAILLPVSLKGNHKVVFTLGSNIYTWNMSGGNISDNELKAYHKYSYKVTINKHGLELTGSINDWKEADNSEVDAD